MYNPFLTLDEFTIQELRLFPGGTGELSHLLRDIGLAAKRINVEINKAGLQDILGTTGKENVQGEEVKQLDEFANKQMINALRQSVSCAGACSEEEEEIIVFNDPLNNQSKYVVLFDPLDGSSNIETCISIGTVFSIFRRVSANGSPCTVHDFLQPGNLQVAAGYIFYGSSTMFVYATKLGVNGFTLDPSIGEFCLSHPNIKCGTGGRIISVNSGMMQLFPKRVQEYLSHLQSLDGGRRFTFRYTGSLVADLHRNLIKGGIFLYPSTHDKPAGKLRLLYECNPFAFVYSIAGGKATDGKINILDIVATNIHQRSPLYIGDSNLVEEFRHMQRNQLRR